MKNLTKLLPVLSFIVLFSFTACSQSSQGSEPDTQQPTFKVKVDFHCMGGKNRIENHFKDVEGVIEVDADLKTKVVSIVYMPDVIEKETLVLEIEKAGHRTELTPDDREVISRCSHGDHDDDQDYDHEH